MVKHAQFLQFFSFYDINLSCIAPLVQWQNGGIVNHKRQSDSDRGLKRF